MELRSRCDVVSRNKFKDKKELTALYIETIKTTTIYFLSESRCYVLEDK
jgi:hypothetical protein